MQGDSLRQFTGSDLRLHCFGEISRHWISGPETTYTHQAALKNFGTTLSYRALPDIPDAFSRSSKGNAITGWFPSKIRLKGRSTVRLDLLAETELSFVSQVFLKVVHCVLSLSPLDEIEDVRSKDQALAQCGEWLRRNLPQARLIPVSSTAEAVLECKTRKTSGAIAGKLAGGINEVPMQAEGIQDRKNNTTRFLVVARRSLPKRENVVYRTSLVLSLSDQVGPSKMHLSLFRKRFEFV